MDNIQRYAIDLVFTGAEHAAFDDLDEKGVFSNENQWKKACDLAASMARTIYRNPESFIKWYKTTQEGR